MSTVFVTGGTGALGRHVVTRLQERGDEVRVLSRRWGAGTHVGDLNTGAGVADAARGAELVVHAASDTRRFGRADLRQTEHLLKAAKDAQQLELFRTRRVWDCGADLGIHGRRHFAPIRKSANKSK